MPLTFSRFLQVSAAVTLGTTPPIPITNLDGDGLVIGWDITRPRRGAESGRIWIANLAASVRGTIKQAFENAQAKVPASVVAGRANAYMEQAQGNLEIAKILAARELAAPYGYKVSLAIGWEGSTRVVYKGDAIDLQPSTQRGQDVFTEFTIGSQAIQDAAVGASFSEITIVLLVRFLVESPAPNGLGLRVDPASLAKIQERGAALGITRYASWAKAGKTATILTDLVAMLGLEWKIHNGRWLVTEQGNEATADPEAFVLSPASGMADFTPSGGGGVYEGLAIPDIRSGHQLVILPDDRQVTKESARYRADAIRFFGSTESGSDMTIDARRSELV